VPPKYSSWIVNVACTSYFNSMHGINKAVQQAPAAVRSVSNAFGYEAGQMSKIMSSSKGRDKICALIQYSVELYVNCMKHSKEYSDLVE